MAVATSHVVSQLQRSIARAIYGKEDVIQLALVTLLARGHLLIEDVPGTGKTTLAQALAKSFHCTFQRIQFTSDLLPSDVLGVSVYNPESREFEFRQGPIFANVVLADEINRTRKSDHLALGVSPRGTLMLQRAAQARAFLDGRDFCLPDDFKHLAIAVFSHRVVASARHASLQKKSETTENVLREIVDSVPVPL